MRQVVCEVNRVRKCDGSEFFADVSESVGRNVSASPSSFDKLGFRALVLRSVVNVAEVVLDVLQRVLNCCNGLRSGDAVRRVRFDQLVEAAHLVISSRRAMAWRAWSQCWVVPTDQSRCLTRRVNAAPGLARFLAAVHWATMVPAGTAFGSRADSFWNVGLGIWLYQGIVERYDKMAERQRQLRDEETKTIDERIAANKQLQDVLKQGEAEEKKNIEARIAGLNQQIAVNKTNVELQNERLALQQELLGVEAKYESLMSETFQNESALKREALEIDKSRREASIERMFAVGLSAVIYFLY